MSAWVVPIVLMIPLAGLIGFLRGAGTKIEERRNERKAEWSDVPPEAREAFDSAFRHMDKAFAEFDRAFDAHPHRPRR